MTTGPAPSTTAADVIVDALLAGGLTDLVLCPGSRSAPLAYAARRAERGGRLRLHVRIDERTAGFLALGLAKADGRPVAVITTSGTAVGNLLPSVMEAFHARVPLIVISADRPATMINTGANQTTEQRGLFTGHVRGEGRLASLGGSPRAWRFAVDRLVALADARYGGVAGPAHLDVELSDPLTPTDAGPLTAPAPAPTVALAPSSPAPRHPAPSGVPVPAGAGTVIVAGDLSPERGRALADQAAAARIPLLAEPSSNARHGETALATYRLLLGTSLGEAVDRVIMVGRPTLSRPVQRLLGRDDVEVIIVEPSPEWIDPALSNARPVPAVELDPGPTAWLDRWRDADTRLLATLTAEPTMIDGRVAPAALARAVADHADGVLVLGSSNPVRDVDLVALGDRPREVYANRGLAGIDGTVSTAVGIALSRPDQVTTALLGDLTFLHDQTGFAIPVGEPRPDGLRFVVANDDGGSIFATLEYGAPELRDDFERLFATATGADLGALCAGWGITHRRVTDHDQLVASLRTDPVGIEVVEVITDRRDRPEQTRRWAAAARAATTP